MNPQKVSGFFILQSCPMGVLREGAEDTEKAQKKPGF
jgi:hypothetical protein